MQAPSQGQRAKTHTITHNQKNTLWNLGRHMNLKVIAEGVETDAQLVFLRQFGCTLIQGFILSRPKQLADLMDYLPS